MSNLAFSYLRFSTPEQARGDSKRRQIAMAESYASEHRLKLDKHLSFRDLGVSAFRGENAREGALRAFLEAVEHGLVPPGSTLLIESLDRLSRERIIAAQTLFLQIIQAGVTIVTLMDRKTYSVESLNRNPLDLIVSLVVLMRANEESQTKSESIRASFEQRRARLSEKPWSSRCPGWLRLDKATGQFVVVEARAAILRRIFDEALSGIGHQTIARRLNDEMVPLFGHGNQKGKLWTRTLVRHFLRFPAVVGHFTPTTSTHMDGVKQVHALPTITEYYPAVVDQQVWQTIQEKRREWSQHHRNNVPKTGRANLLAGLAKCPYCGTAMALNFANNPNWRYYICRRAFFGVGCSDRWVRYPDIEATFTRGIDQVIRSCPKPQIEADLRAHRLDHIRRRLHSLRKRLASVEQDRSINWQNGRLGRGTAEQIRSEMDVLFRERKSLRIDRPKWLYLTLQPRLARLREIALSDPLDRHGLNTQLKSLIDRIVVDWPRGQLVVQWKHGGESRIPVLIQPLRTVCNPRRSDRPRLGPGRQPFPLPEPGR